MFDIQESARPPIESGDPLLQIRLGVASLGGEDRSLWTATAKSDRLVELLDVKERVDAEVLRLTASWDRDRAWEIDGSLSPRSWLSYRTPLSDGDAQRLVKSAQLADQHPQIADALASGDITTPHVAAIGRAISKDREPLLVEHVETLVDQARKLSVGDFTTVVRHWASLADDQLAKESFAKKWDRRHLHVAVGLDGWVTGDFYLDPLAGASLIAALDHEAPPDPADAPEGPRQLSQRRADALVDIVGRHIDGAEPGSNPPNVNAVIDVATLLGKPQDLAAVRCEIDGVGPVARTVLDQMGCDGRFTRFIMSGPTQILDMGRSTRFVTKPQRRALIVRDRHCRFPSCRRPTQWCDAHHVAGWIESRGETNIDNLILLCRRHHTLVHNSKWTIAVTSDGGFEFTQPARGP